MIQIPVNFARFYYPTINTPDADPLAVRCIFIIATQRTFDVVSLKVQSNIKRFIVPVLVVQMFVALAIAQANFSLMRDLALSRYGQSTAEFVDEWHR